MVGGGYGQPSVGAVWSWGRSGLLTFRAPSGAQSHWGQKGREESERAVPGAPLCGPAEGLGAAREAAWGFQVSPWLSGGSLEPGDPWRGWGWGGDPLLISVHIGKGLS